MDRGAVEKTASKLIKTNGACGSDHRSNTNQTQIYFQNWWNPKPTSGNTKDTSRCFAQSSHSGVLWRAILRPIGHFSREARQSGSERLLCPVKLAEFVNQKCEHNGFETQIYDSTQYGKIKDYATSNSVHTCLSFCLALLSQSWDFISLASGNASQQEIITSSVPEHWLDHWDVSIVICCGTYAS